MPRVEKKLTEKIIAKLEAPDPSTRQTLHWDCDLKGFAVLCSGVSNARTYIVQRDLPRSGKTRRVTVGSVNEISLETARARAADMLDDLRRGIDPKQKITKLTLRETLENYLAARKNLRPASVRAYRHSAEKHLTSWLDMNLRDISPDMVEARHISIAQEVVKGDHIKGEVTANLAMRVLRILWNYAAERVPDLPPNPVRRMSTGRQWYKEPRRERVVHAEELPKFYEAICAQPNQVARDYLLLVLFTGLRLSESATLTWEDIDLPLSVIRIPTSRTKADRKLDLPMSDFVRDLLIARRALGDARFVFPGPGKKGHLGDPRAVLRSIAVATGIKVSVHDLRRTYLTVADSADISAIAMKALVNHSVGKDVTGGYVIMSVERLREAAQCVCDKMKALCGVVSPSGENVAKLGSR